MYPHTYTFVNECILTYLWRLINFAIQLPHEVTNLSPYFPVKWFVSWVEFSIYYLTHFIFFFSLLRLFLQSPANPDLLYIIFFCHTQLTVTLLLALIFGSKVSFYFVRLLRWLMQTIQLNNLTSECVCVQNYEILRTNILDKLLSW